MNHLCIIHYSPYLIVLDIQYHITIIYREKVYDYKLRKLKLLKSVQIDLLDVLKIDIEYFVLINCIIFH